eukprot:GHVN01030485.1.p1 GENE.GHVN01030485.1~~GHVN01030485.1.p1  ORF type:complete len:417 (+),score=46.28 GHVN01030485.1:2482-3732(+)
MCLAASEAKLCLDGLMSSFLLNRKRTSLADIDAFLDNIPCNSFKDVLLLCRDKKTAVDGVLYKEKPELQLFVGWAYLATALQEGVEAKFLPLVDFFVNKFEASRLKGKLANKILGCIARIPRNVLGNKKLGLLLHLLSVARLGHEKMQCAVLINGIIGEYISSADFRSAKNFVSVCNFPEDMPFFLQARHLFYVGKVHAHSLCYDEACMALSRAMDIVPRTRETSGFRQCLARLLVMASLLGNRKICSDVLKASGECYKALSALVLGGNKHGLSLFLEERLDLLQKDGNNILSAWLEKNTVQNGVRRLCSAYKSIPAAEAVQRLSLGSIENLRHLLAECAADGILHADIEGEWLVVRKPEEEACDDGKTTDAGIRQCISLVERCRQEIIYSVEKKKREEPAWGDEEEDAFIFDAEF